MEISCRNEYVDFKILFYFESNTLQDRCIHYILDKNITFDDKNILPQRIVQNVKGLLNYRRGFENVMKYDVEHMPDQFMANVIKTLDNYIPANGSIVPISDIAYLKNYH